MSDTQVAEAPSAEMEDVSLADEAGAIEMVSRMLRPQETEAPTQADTSTVDATPEEEAPEAPSEEVQTEETPPEESVSEESPEEGEELPNTLPELAEYLSVDPSDLAANLTVKIEGQEVTLAELMRGHLREADYIRKTEDLADKRKALEAEQGRFQAQSTQHQKRFDDLITLLQSQIETGPSNDELNRLLQDDPHEYLRQKQMTDGRMAALQQAMAARMQREHQLQQENQKREADYRAEQQAALKREMPGLSDEKQVASLEKSVVSAAKRYGFTDEETNEFINGPWDHRHILMLKDLAEYHQFNEGKTKLPKKLKSKPRVQRPGSASDKTSREADARTTALNRMRQRRDDRSAVAYVSNLLR